MRDALRSAFIRIIQEISPMSKASKPHSNVVRTVVDSLIFLPIELCSYFLPKLLFFVIDKKTVRQ